MTLKELYDRVEKIKKAKMLKPTTDTAKGIDIIEKEIRLKDRIKKAEKKNPIDREDLKDIDKEVEYFKNDDPSIDEKEIEDLLNPP